MGSWAWTTENGLPSDALSRCVSAFRFLVWLRCESAGHHTCNCGMGLLSLDQSSEDSPVALPYDVLVSSRNLLRGRGDEEQLFT